MKNGKEVIKFGKKLKQLRKEAGLTQNALAFEAEIGRATIQRIESGDHALSLDLIFNLAKALRVQPEKMFEGVEVKFED